MYMYMYVLLFDRAIIIIHCRLVDTFPAFLEQEEMEDSGFEALFKSSFPKSIKLKHTVDLWKKIVKSEAEKRNTS